MPHITLKSIANNAEIDAIWDRLQPAVEQALADLNAALAGHSDPFPVTTGGRAGQSIDFTARGDVTLPSGEPAPAGGFMEWEVPRAPAQDDVHDNLHDASMTKNRQRHDPAERVRNWPEAARVALDRF